MLQRPPFCVCDEPESVPARDLGDRLQSWNVPFGIFSESG